MLVTTTMYESLRSTSQLPSPKTNVNVSTSLNSYITHPTEAGPGGLQPIQVFFWVGATVGWHMQSPLIVPLIIVAIKQEKLTVIVLL